MLALYTISIAAATMAIACHWGYIRELSSDLTSVAYDYNVSYVIFFMIKLRSFSSLITMLHCLLQENEGTNFSCLMSI